MNRIERKEILTENKLKKRLLGVCLVILTLLSFNLTDVFSYFSPFDSYSNDADEQLYNEWVEENIVDTDTLYDICKAFEDCN